MPKIVSTASVATDIDGASYYGQATTNSILTRVFQSCSDDPKSSIHRAWGLTLILLVIFFIMSVIEMVNLKSSKGSRAVMLASVFTGIVHLVLGILGTFVLKRFPTSFSIGFFMGVLVVLANQNFILTGTFFWYSHGNPQTNRVFANLGFGLFLVLTFFSLMLFHFKGEIVVAPIDTKHHHHHSPNQRHSEVVSPEESSQMEHATDYSQYTEDQP
ncbi:hypothetical protein ACA910_010585 [Epithemia clementina (nom. ined.)]